MPASAAVNTSKRETALGAPAPRKDGRASRDPSPGAALSPALPIATRIGAPAAEAGPPGGQSVVKRKTSLGSSGRPRSASSTQRGFAMPSSADDPLPVPRKSVTTLALQNVGKLRDKTALVDAATGRATTYGELERTVKMAALGLRRFGYKAGSVFAFVGGGGVDWAAAFHAVALVGGTVTLVPPNANVDAAVAQMKEGGAAAIFATEPACDLALDVSSRNAQIQDVFVFGVCNGATPFAELVARNRRASRIRSSIDASVMGPLLAGLAGGGTGSVRGAHPASIAESSSAVASGPSSGIPSSASIRLSSQGPLRREAPADDEAELAKPLEELQAPVSLYSHPLVLLYRHPAGSSGGGGPGSRGTPRSGSGVGLAGGGPADLGRLALSHHNIAAAALQLAAAEDWDHDDVSVALPHAYAPYHLIASYVLPFYLGSTVVAMASFALPAPSQRSLSSSPPTPPLLSGVAASSPVENAGAGFEAWLALVTDHRATRADVTAPLLLALLKSPAVDAHLPSLTRLRSLNAGPVLCAEAFQRLVAIRFGPAVRLRLGYGSFEAPLTHLTPPKAQFGVAGVPLVGTACRIVDERTGQPAAPGRSGAIYVRGPQVARPVPMLAAPADEEAPPQLWVPTGDHGSVDEEGCLRVSDPRRDVLFYDGVLRVPLAHVEAVLLSHPSVHDAAIVPVPDEEHHQVAKAYVVPSSTHATHANLAQLELFNWIKAGDPASKAAAAASGQAAAEGQAAAAAADGEGRALKPSKSIRGGPKTPGRARPDSPDGGGGGGPGITVTQDASSGKASDSPRAERGGGLGAGPAAGDAALSRAGRSNAAVAGTTRAAGRAAAADSDEEGEGGPPRPGGSRRASRGPSAGGAGDWEGPEEKDPGRLRELLSPSAPPDEPAPGPATTGLSRQAAELMALAQEVKAYVADRLSPYAQLRVVEFMPRLPKSPSGRTLHRRLLEKEDNAYSDEETAVPAF